ncbi:SRPBCC family protein [Advenella mimigardefordensis]|uniref:START-like domain-containing protein n=1 Tax=Advenella mimigardefordensis (strain DSM 17166 / LMG 22922 / DPN7) TaxID=1247726 RepID=W0PHI9_ADVMD|nr:SRPBCC family protein [Advenella mimigardefordensis]AHG65986.1 START-like domain-containing protein [Advenella mimigardefordensis DPN7]
MSSNQIEKSVTLAAPVARVWHALTDAQEFGQWFGVALEGPFIEGAAIRGTFIGPLDVAVIEQYQRQAGVTPAPVNLPQESTTFCTVQAMEPERYFSFRWIPFGIDAQADPDNEPTTLVEFRLAPVAGGTQLTITESGFDDVPAHRRARAFLMNTGGWEAQIRNVKQYVERD